MLRQTRWIFYPEARAAPVARLVCFPYAGAGAAVYRDWPRGLPDWLEVCALQPPGRGPRLAEPPYRDLQRLIDEAVEPVAALMDRPVAFFGHSLGAWVAAALADRFDNLGIPPRALFVSGLGPPTVRRALPDLRDLDDGAFVEELNRRYDGIPAEIINEPDLLALALPALRADMEAMRSHEPGPTERLSCPIIAFGGAADPTANRRELEAWRAETGHSFRLEVFPGGHFFIASARARILEIIATEMQRGLGTAVSPLSELRARAPHSDHLRTLGARE